MKQVAKMLDISEHTIRYYTDLDIFPCERDNGNRRVFDEEAINWLIGIKNLRVCGMSVEAVKQYCHLCVMGDSTIEERFQIILEQKKTALIKLEEAQKAFEYVEQKAEHYKEILERQIPDDTNPTTWKWEENQLKRLLNNVNE
jgi:DNA-binding transcriptional MerR regulator